MTLGEATDRLRQPPLARACVGPGPGTHGLCYCAWRNAQERTLQRAAHIVARQLANLRDRTGGARG